MAFNWIKFGEINETFDNIRNMNDADLDHFLHNLIQYCYDKGWSDYNNFVCTNDTEGRRVFDSY